jgi:hypothetical protein
LQAVRFMASRDLFKFCSIPVEQPFVWRIGYGCLWRGGSEGERNLLAHFHHSLINNNCHFFSSVAGYAAQHQSSTG